MLCRNADELRSEMAASSISATLATNSAMMSPNWVDRSKCDSVAETKVTEWSRAQRIKSERSNSRRTIRSARKNMSTSNSPRRLVSQSPSWGRSNGDVEPADTSKSSAMPTTS